MITAGPVVHTIRLRPSWWTGPAAPGRNLRRAAIATWRALLAYAVAVLAAATLGTGVLHWQVLAATALITIPLLAVLAWQWDTTTGIDAAARAAQVRTWRTITGRHPGITGTIRDAAALVERWARSELAVLRTAGGAW
jgi:hypothetical protein